MLDDDLDVDWETDPTYHKTLDDKQIDVGKISNRIMFLQAIPATHLSVDMRLAFRRMVGEGMARILEGDERNAEAILDQAEGFVTARNREQARRWYVQSSVVATVAACALTASAAAIYRKCFQPAEGDLTNILAVGFGGSVGALFSILLRVGHAPLDPSAGIDLHRLEASARVAVGVIGAALVLTAVHVGILLPKLADSYGLVLVCIIAGASERAAWALIERVEVALSDPDMPKRRAVSKNQGAGPPPESKKPKKGVSVVSAVTDVPQQHPTGPSSHPGD